MASGSDFGPPPPQPTSTARATTHKVRLCTGRGVCQPPPVLPLKDNIPTRRQPIVTIAIIVICAFVYFFLQKGGISGPNDNSVVKFAAIPYEITHPGKHCGLTNGGTVEPGPTAICSASAASPPSR